MSAVGPTDQEGRMSESIEQQARVGVAEDQLHGLLGIGGILDADTEEHVRIVLAELARVRQDRDYWVELWKKAANGVLSLQAEKSDVEASLAAVRAEIIKRGNACAVWITGDPEQAPITHEGMAWSAIDECIRLGQERNNELQAVRAALGEIEQDARKAHRANYNAGAYIAAQVYEWVVDRLAALRLGKDGE
jgi:hypothetical protein